MRRTLLLAAALLASACAGDSTPAGPQSDAPAVAPAADPAADTANRPSVPAGTAELSLEGDGVSISGSHASVHCGGPFLMGYGVAYQVQAGEWLITVASEERVVGEVPMNATDEDINVVAIANGPRMRYARGPRDTGSLTLGDDFRTADAKLELRQIGGPGRARLRVRFDCE